MGYFDLRIERRDLTLIQSVLYEEADHYVGFFFMLNGLAWKMLGFGRAVSAFVNLQEAP